jgi:hypothetical protein
MKLTALILGATLAVRAGAGTSAEVALATTAISSEPEVVAPGTSGIAGLQVEEVWLAFKNVGFREAATCDEAATPQVKGPITAELIRGRTTGLAEKVKLRPGPYCGVELTLRRSRGRADGVPADLRGHSLLVRAKRDDGVRVVVRSRSTLRVWLAARDEDGFAVVGDDSRWFLAADLARWLSALDLTTADVAREGGREIIRIDDRNNAALLSELENRLASGLGLYRDADRDGELQPEERAGDDWLATGDPDAATRVSRAHEVLPGRRDLLR